MNYRLRFAPSPTGYIHLGNVRSALYNWFLAKQNSGSFILRLDDTDRQRSQQRFADAIIEDLDWLGLTPDENYRQSERIALYDKMARQLKDSGLLYPAYETPDELEYMRKRQLARGKPPVYDRRALNMSAAEQTKLTNEGREPHWRFKLPSETITFSDLIRGEQSVDLTSISDPVLIREDGSYLYTLPSICDDIDMEISHVIRGEDHVTNTGAQIAIFNALGAKVPTFAHHNILSSSDGIGFSKREGKSSIRALRESGMEAITVATIAALTGTSEAITPYQDLGQLTKDFKLTTVSRSTAALSIAQLESLNEKVIHNLPFAKVKQRLNEAGIDCDEQFWLAMRANINNWRQAIDWWHILHNPVPELNHDDHDFLQTAADLLPKASWNDQTIKNWLDELKRNTDRRGKNFFMPLRSSLTGIEHGPELVTIIKLLGYNQTYDRLSRANKK